MIAFLRGQVVHKGVGYLVLQVGSIGLRVYVCPEEAMALPIGAEAALHTHLLVREDGMFLYGFSDRQSLELFQRLLGVSGVGPRLAMALVSTLGAEGLAQAVERGDVASISRTPGVGQKTAARIVLELRGKLAGPPSTVREELVATLKELGFKPAEIEAVLKGWDIPVDAQPDELLAEALRRLGG